MLCILIILCYVWFMDLNDLTMPESLTSLRDKVSFLEKDIHRYEVENNILREQVRHLRSQLFAAKTEKKVIGKDDGQALLFNEAETCISEEEEQVALVFVEHQINFDSGMSIKDVMQFLQDKNETRVRRILKKFLKQGLILATTINNIEYFYTRPP